MLKHNPNRFFQKLQAAIPSPKSELNFGSAFELLIAVILSAQSTDKQVNKVTQILFAKARTPKAILALGEDELRASIQSLGLFNAKARHIMQSCQLLLTKHDSKIPDNLTELIKLPGVGRKTANVVLNTVFKQGTIAVDTHVYRVCNKTGFAPGKTPLEVEQVLMTKVPEKFLLDAHHYLVLHGRYVCTARQPKCTSCAINDECQYFNLNIKE